jgi:hypothetical protein
VDRVVGRVMVGPPRPDERGPGTRGRHRRARPSGRRGGGPSPRAWACRSTAAERRPPMKFRRRPTFGACLPREVC